MFESIIQVRDLQTQLGGVFIHDKLDLDIKSGEIMAIIGDSGCGKTTLLQAILLLLTPKMGSIRIFDQEILKLNMRQETELKRRWGVMFQHSALFSSLSILENVAFPLKEFTNLPKKLINEIALLKLSMVGLPMSAANKWPSELSGGMQKRAAMARAIAMDPELLFLDEPTSGLDPQSAGAFDDLILHMRESLGLTVVLVTHDLDTIWHVPDRVAFIADKKVVANQPIAELVRFSHPSVQEYFSGLRAKARERAAGE